MKHCPSPLRSFFLCIAVVSSLAACGGKHTDQRTTQPLPALEYLDSKIQSWVDSAYFNGAVLRVVKNDSLFFESFYGGYTDTTALHVASAGKWVAAAVIASIVDEGKLSWDDPVKKYLPEFKDLKGEATLRQLLSHTAGYPDYQPEGTRRDDYQTLKEAVENILPLPADTLPGTKFRYGGLAMQVAGRMAEIATGKDWETLFQERIARPLDMKYSYFVPVSEEPGFNPMLAGGLKTCLHDYMNFLNMLAHDGKFEGKQILSSKAVGEIEADPIKAAHVRQPEYPYLVRQYDHDAIYGLGMWREELDENGRATLVSSPGWAGVYPWIDRKNKVYGCYLSKANGKAFSEGFSPFYATPVLPLIIRDALVQAKAPETLKRGKINLGGAQLYYEEMGEGEPVVFIHGHSLNHRMWDTQFYEFAKQYRAIRYDLRGYGYSSPQSESGQFTHAEDLAQLLDSLQIEKAHIVGLSLGGYIGTDLLGWFPEKILSAVLASGNIRHWPKPSVPMDGKEAEKRDEEIAALKKKGIEPMKWEWFEGLMRSGGTQRERMRLPLWSMVYQWDAWQPLHKEVRVVAGDDAYDLLKENKPDIPVLIVEGKSEHNRFPEHPEILEHLPAGRLTVIDNAGHMLNMEQPEAFNNTVLEFIRKAK